MKFQKKKKRAYIQKSAGHYERKERLYADIAKEIANGNSDNINAMITAFNISENPVIPGGRKL